jgi:glycerophosphoryl diester phosphodiesterase
MLILAHRGHSSQYPENSAPAFESAIAVGADYLETDLRLSKDHKIVCCHDPDLKRIAGRTDAIADLTLDEIKSTPLTSSEMILTFSEVIEIIRRSKRPVQIMLDVKVQTEDMAKRIFQSLKDIDAARTILFGAREIEIARFLNVQYPEIAVLGMPKKTGLIPAFLDTDVSAVRVWEEDVTAEIVASIKAAHKPIFVTAGLRSQGEAAGFITDDRILNLHDLGIDAVLVNDPLRVRQVLDQAGQTEMLRAGELA